MKKIKYYLMVLFTITLTSSVIKGQTGNLSGFVIDEDNFNLISANIFIPSNNLGTVTNNSGKYFLSNIPVGEYDVIFSYIGYQAKQVHVVIKKQKTTELNVVLNSGIINGEEVVILGEKLKGQAKALNQQYNKMNITNVISSDQIGRFPDANIADALKRVPAISVYYDLGEAKFANIRGTEPRLNSVMINGERVPSAEGQTRSIQLDFFPSDMIQTIEVNKALTPDMDADAIGGSVNLITKAAPSQTKITTNIGSNYNLFSRMFAPVGNFTLGSRFLEGNLGVLITGSYFDNNLGADNIESDWVKSAENSIPNTFQIRDYKVRRLRKSIGANIDLRFNRHILYLRGLYNHRDDWEKRYRLSYKNIKDDGNGNYTAEARRETKGGIKENDYSRLEKQKMWNTSVSGEHIFDKFKINWSASYAKASEERPNERYIVWRAKNVPITLDLSNNRNPKVLDNLDYSNFSLKEITEEYQFTQEKDFNTKVDIEIPLELFNDGILKIGGRTRNKVKERNNNFIEYTPLTEPSSLLDYPNKDFSKSNFLAGNYSIGRLTTTEHLGSLELNNSALFEKELVLSEYVALNYNANENILAAYSMLDQKISDKAEIILGLRIENTKVDYTGFKFNEETDSMAVNKGSDDYYNILPGIHLKYSTTNNSFLRIAWTNTIARPNYYDLVPYKYMAKDLEEIVLGNPSLTATSSMNFDIMYENYLESVGLFSAGIFYKNISDFIYVHSERNYLDQETNLLFEEFHQPRNGASATLFGFEFTIQKRLDFLPGILKDISLYTNYTFTKSSADNPNFNSQQGYKKHISLPGSSPHMFNANLTYQDKSLTLGISFNYTSEYLDPEELDLTPKLERYYDAVTYLDANAAYAFSNYLRFFIEANNLLNQPLRFYSGEVDNTAQAEFYNVHFNAGIKYDL